MSEFVKRLAGEMGFDRCGIARAAPIGRADYVRAWLDSGRAGSMGYLHRHFTRRVDPRALLEGARSVVVVALLYHLRRPGDSEEADHVVRSRVLSEPRTLARAADQPSDASESSGPRSEIVPSGGAERRGRVARYAWGDDYHEVVRTKLRALINRLHAELSEPFEAKLCVDTVPLLERELAAMAGIGWIGKNTMVLNHKLGSYFFLGEVVTTLDLPPDEPLVGRCGACTACLDACPTGAFPVPYEMDASRCISYLTIEHRGDIPGELKEPMRDWIFGCDICQEVCPYNRRAPTTREPRFAIRSPRARPSLEAILRWSKDDYNEQLRGSAMKRAAFKMWKRNARIAMDNARR